MGLTVTAGPRREHREGELPGAGVVSAATHSDLTKAEQGNVRTALAFLRARCGGLKPLAKALRLTATTLRATATPTLAYRVARLASVGVDGVLTGKYPPPGRAHLLRAPERRCRRVTGGMPAWQHRPHVRIPSRQGSRWRPRGVPARGPHPWAEMELVQRCSTAKRQARGDGLAGEECDERARDDKVLLDLSICDPRCVLAPLGDEVLRDHASGSTAALTASFQRSTRCAPVRGLARTRGATACACWFT
jgi:hypothetical protein